MSRVHGGSVRASLARKVDTVHSTLLNACYNDSFYVRFTLAVVFTFDISNGGLRDMDVGVNCGGARKCKLSRGPR